MTGAARLLWELGGIYRGGLYLLGNLGPFLDHILCHLSYWGKSALFPTERSFSGLCPETFQACRYCSWGELYAVQQSSGARRVFVQCVCFTWMAPCNAASARAQHRAWCHLWCIPKGAVPRLLLSQQIKPVTNNNTMCSLKSIWTAYSLPVCVQRLLEQMYFTWL